MSTAHALLHAFTSGTGAFLLALAGGAAIVLAAALIASGARRLSPGTRHALLWLAVIAPSAFVASAVTGAKRLLAIGGETPPVIGDVLIGVPEVGAATLGGRTPEWPCILVAIWIAVSAVALMRLAMEHARWRRIATRARTGASPVFDRLTKRLGVSPRLGTSDAIREPVVVGVIAPSVLLPNGYADDLTEGELESIFLHELSHVRRRDNLAALASDVVLRLFWFDPLHWLARRRLVELRESACDAAVLEHGGDADGYLSALGKTCAAAALRPAAVSCMSGFRLPERMDTIMAYTRTRPSFVSHRVAVALSIVLLAGAALGFAAVAPEAELASTVMTSEGERHRLIVQVGPERNGVAEVRVNVTTPRGFRILQSLTTVRLGQPVEVSTHTDDGKRYEVHVTTQPDGRGRAVLEVFDRGVLVETVDSDVGLQRSQPGDPIDLHLEDADLADVLKVMSQLTGVPIEAARGISGKVSISVDDTPWDVALAEAIRPLGLTFMSTEGKIWVIRSGSVPDAGIRQREDGVYRVGGDVKPPQVLSRVDPIYPAEAKAARVVGIVILETVIGEDGVVRDVKVLKGLPFGLSEAAADAVRQWTFSPATIEGKAVPVLFNLTINFKLAEPEP